MTCQSFRSLLSKNRILVASSESSICSTVCQCHNSDHIVRGIQSSLKTLSALPRLVRPIFSKISDLHFIMCHISSVPRGNGFSQDSLFRCNKQDALCYKIFFNETRRKSILQGIWPGDRCPQGRDSQITNAK